MKNIIKPTGDGTFGCLTVIAVLLLCMSTLAAKYYFSFGYCNKGITENIQIIAGKTNTLLNATEKSTVVFTNMQCAAFADNVIVSNANCVKTIDKRWVELTGTLDCGTAKVIRLKGITVGTVIARNARTAILLTNENTQLVLGTKTKTKIK